MTDAASKEPPTGDQRTGVFRRIAEIEDLSFPWAAPDTDSPWTVYVRGSRMVTVSDAFNEFSAALQFPQYFGENWSAFDDCITDLRWIPKSRVDIWLIDFSDALRGAGQGNLSSLLDSLSKATEYLAAPQFPEMTKSIRVFLHARLRRQRELEETFRRLRIPLPELFSV